MPRLVTVVGALVALALAVALLFTNQTAHALTITVDSLADVVADDAECTLREAIENANDTTDGQPNDDCAAGDPDGEDTIDFDIDGTIILDGAELPPVTDHLVIDGGGEIVIDGDEASRILTLSNDASLALLDLTLTGGDAGEDDGGAVLVEAGTLEVAGATFSGNQAEAGGAIRLLDGALDIVDSGFEANGAGDIGGALSVEQGNAAVADSTFNGNTADGSGGAISSSGDLVVDGASFTMNSANDGGGAIAAEAPLQVLSGTSFTGNNSDFGGAIAAEASVEITGAVFSENSALNGGAIGSLDQLAIVSSSFHDNDATNGGAIDQAGDFEVNASLFEGNSAIVEGGAIRLSLALEGLDSSIMTTTFEDNHALTGGAIMVVDGPLAITRSTFYLNSVTAQGGAISNSGELSVVNSTFSANAADTGGGGLSNSGEAVVRNVTFAGNSALADDAGSILNHDAAILDVTNTIVTLGNLGVNCELQGTVTGVEDSNLSDDDSCDPGLFVQVDDVMLGALEDNGGPTETHLPDLDSPAIDGGDDESCPATDQRGEERIANQGCDIGSVEVQDVPVEPLGDQFVPGLASQVDHP